MFVDPVMKVLRDEITEDRTDELLDFIFDNVSSHVPFYLRPFAGIAKRIVDRFLPEQLLDAIEKLLIKYA